MAELNKTEETIHKSYWLITTVHENVRNKQCALRLSPTLKDL